MTGAELRSIRKSLGLTLSQFGKALGYSGNKNTLSVQIRRFEKSTGREPEPKGARTIPEWIARLATSLQREGRQA